MCHPSHEWKLVVGHYSLIIQTNQWCLSELVVKSNQIFHHNITIISWFCAFLFDVLHIPNLKKKSLQLQDILDHMEHEKYMHWLPKTHQTIFWPSSNTLNNKGDFLCFGCRGSVALLQIRDFLVTRSLSGSKFLFSSIIHVVCC